MHECSMENLPADPFREGLYPACLIIITQGIPSKFTKIFLFIDDLNYQMQSSHLSETTFSLECEFDSNDSKIKVSRIITLTKFRTAYDFLERMIHEIYFFFVIDHIAL